MNSLKNRVNTKYISKSKYNIYISMNKHLPRYSLLGPIYEGVQCTLAHENLKSKEK